MQVSLLKTTLPIFVAVMVLVTATNNYAQIPQTIHYQGYITNIAGQPVNAAANVTFRLYTAASGGTAVWTETQSGVNATNGIYNAVLGSVTAFNLPFNVPYYLSLQINSDAEMTGRQPLSAVPYAVRAVTAEALSAGAAIPASQLTGTIAPSQLPATQLLPTEPCLPNQIPHWDEKSWVCRSGTPGPAGPAGPQGIAGMTGPAGPQGPAGTILTLPQLQGMFVQSSIVQAPQVTSLTAADTSVGVGSHSSLTIGGDGLPVISYYDITNGDLKVSKCGNAACSTGSTINTIDAGGNVGQYTSISIGADGLPVISYYDVTNGDLKVAKCGNAACSVGSTITAVDTAGDVGQYTSIAIGADGLPVVAYYDVTNAHPKVVKCGNPTCSAGNTTTTVDSATGVGDYAAIAIGAGGLPVISYRGGGVIKLAKCGNAACSTGNVLGTLAGFGGKSSSGLVNSLTIGADGMPTLLYVDIDTTVRSLGLAKCSIPSCYAGGIVAGFALPVGAFRGTSMTIGVDGLPVIAYMEANQLKVVKCGNILCSVGNSANDLVDVGSTGGYPSISIGTDGLPVISYFDGNSNTLKVAKCANTYCVAAFRQR